MFERKRSDQIARSERAVTFSGLSRTQAGHHHESDQYDEGGDDAAGPGIPEGEKGKPVPIEPGADDLSHQKSGDDEEDVDSGEAAGPQRPEVEVKRDDAHDCERPQSVDVVPEPSAVDASHDRRCVFHA